MKERKNRGNMCGIFLLLIILGRKVLGEIKRKVGGEEN
jgi:hypothetical protein